MEEEIYSIKEIHKEKVFEEHIHKCLIQDQGYIERICETDYDVSLAIDKEILFKFLKSSQPNTWQKLLDHYINSAEEEFLKRLQLALKSEPTYKILRNGIKLVPNINFDLCYFKPASNLNKTLSNLHKKNIFSSMRQVKYSARNNNSIDIVTFINGIPITTIEVKNNLTRQNYRHAEKQYREDRPPAGEPLLTFKRGAIVHFAIDQRCISMTTKLMNKATKFLPFNRGREGGEGNEDIVDETNVAYFYKNLPESKAIMSKEVLLDIISRYLHLEKKDGKENLIFPRFHQLNVVRKILSDTQKNGCGQNYLVQHSAGSGKSNTIAWISHQIINAHNDQDESIFDSAIIVTDRLALDRQLQKTITSFSQTRGVVEVIEGTSKDLKSAIELNKRIIITTIQKFGTEHLLTLSGQAKKKFAVIIDEAHSSQAGKSSQAMSEALTRDEEVLEEINDFVLKQQNARGPQKNISFLAFTATPRNVTLERFGSLGIDGKPYPFDLYSMRQAIEEGFIVDVLQNYTTYNSYYKLEKAIEDDPVLMGRKGQKKVARFASLTNTAIDEKSEVIVEHFLKHVRGELKNKAKAMLVTQSREHALKYWKRINSYISKKQYSSIKTIVAFSNKLKIDGQEWTESKANGFSDSQLPSKFESDEFQILIVADKYQTGFDQPKLVAMYVDKKLYGQKAVQTLSRLNRIYPDKQKTYILDFINSIEEIKESFAPYYEASELEDRTDLNQIYDLDRRIKDSEFISEEEIEKFSDIFFVKTLNSKNRNELEQLVKKAVQRFEVNPEESEKEEFRLVLKSFQRFYAFVAQIVSLEDPWLEKLFIYSSWLSRLLPSRNIPGEIKITDEMLSLSAFKLDKIREGSASLVPGESTTLSPITEFAINPYTEDEERSLSDIIETFNERYGTAFTREDFLRFERVNKEIMDQEMKDMMINNPPDVVYTAFSQKFFKEMIKTFQSDQEMQNIVMRDADAREKAIRHFFKRAMRDLE